MKGYYTDKKGKVLGYFDLPSKPEDDEKHTWIESDEKPEIAPSKEKNAFDKKISDQAVAKASVATKLKALGLTDDELDILGIN
jgi:hypothetical protein